MRFNKYLNEKRTGPSYGKVVNNTADEVHVDLQSYGWDGEGKYLIRLDPGASTDIYTMSQEGYDNFVAFGGVPMSQTEHIGTIQVCTYNVATVNPEM